MVVDGAAPLLFAPVRLSCAVLVDVGAQARDRIGGLQGIVTKPGKPRCLVVGHRFDNACHRLRNFLGRNQITFEWLTPDSAELAKRWPDAPLEQLPATGPTRPL